MSTPGIVILCILAGAFVFGLLPFLIMGAVLWCKLLVRTSKKKWGRECSIPDDEEYRRMFEIGIAWDEAYKACKRPVEIKSGRFRLVGEYFDFGCRRAVIIIAGRMESLLYSYFFAEPYRAAGYNVLVIDNRAHGESDGVISSLGYREYRDILNWSALLHDTLGNDTVFLHGICIGCSTALFTLTSPKCPDYLVGMAAEGMYKTFGVSLEKHFEERNKPMFPLGYITMFYLWLFGGANVVTDGPYKRIRTMQKPLLMLHSLEDPYSLPENAKKLFASCPSKDKRIVWFPHGGHSRLRIVDMERYDAEIRAFLTDMDRKTIGQIAEKHL
ncbi:MAG: alpha/beta fold hydrolase [Clostridia bacterium]|nr:alpha/beta fold hydrolase [Clostridia bacterium]